MLNAQEMKKQAAEYSLQYVEDGMTLGLGTGSTVAFLLDALGEKVQSGELKNIKTVSSSTATTEIARSKGIEVLNLNEVENVDLSIDGADEVNPQLIGIKGGGGALLYEKVMAINSERNIWIVDESKLVETLGKFPLPVEVVKYGHTHLLQLFAELGYKPQLRYIDEAAKTPQVTDDGNYIIDLHLEEIDDPRSLERELNCNIGVVENGLFIDIADKVIVGGQKGIREING